MALLEPKKDKEWTELTPEERTKLLAKPSTDCSPEEVKLKLALYENQVQEIVQQKDLSKVGLDDYVLITIPLMPDGNMYDIQGKKYYGKIKVTKRTAEQLMMQVGYAVQMDKELLQHRENGQVVNHKGGFEPGVERYNQIAGIGERE